MAKLLPLCVVIFFASCYAHNGFDPRYNFFQRQFQQQQLMSQHQPAQQAQQKSGYTHPFLRNLQISPDDHKCFSVVKRPYYMTKWFQFPCQQLDRTMPVIRSFMSPMGPMCVTYVREPVARFYRIHSCCPGFKMDNNGKCSIRINDVKKQMQPQQVNPKIDVMPLVAKMRQHMLEKAQKKMEMKMNMMMKLRQQSPMQSKLQPQMNPQMQPQMYSQIQPPQMNSQMQPHMQPMMQPQIMPQMPMQMPMSMQMHMNMMPPRPPMMKHMMNMMNNMENTRRPPKIALLSFKRLPTQAPIVAPPMVPLPQRQLIQRPPFNRGFITFIKRKVFRPEPMLLNQIQAMTSERPVPRFVMSGRHQPMQLTPMGEFHPPMPEPHRHIDRFEPPEMQLAKGQPEITEPVQEETMFNPEPMPTDDYQQHRSGFFSIHHNHEHHGMDHFNGVDLPDTPVEMPQLIVEETPKGAASNMNCIVALESAVKSCLKTNNIEVPDVMTAFEPFNDDMSRYLCESEEKIFACINAAMNDCNDSDDAIVARSMLQETADTVRSMCELRAVSVPDPTVPSQVLTGEIRQDAAIQGADTVATIENVDAIPTHGPAHGKKPEIRQEIAAPSNPTIAPEPSVGAKEVHVQEIKVKEFLLPVLLGAGLGFMILVLFVSLLLCCCCRRRVAKKMTLAKEPEKPPIKDGIYTIGLSPPMYETQGIPPMYYEEAKGEKITSRPMPENTETVPVDESA